MNLRSGGKVVRAAHRDGSVPRKERNSRGGSGALPLRRPEIRVTGQDGGGFRTGSGRTLRRVASRRAAPHRTASHRAESSRAEVSRIVVLDPVLVSVPNAHIYRRRPRAVTRYRFRGRPSSLRENRGSLKVTVVNRASASAIPRGSSSLSGSALTDP